MSDQTAYELPEKLKNLAPYAVTCGRGQWV